MFKTVNLFKRRPDLTREQFVERYETGHRHIGERVLRGSAERYLRRYLEPLAWPPNAPVAEPEYDVVMEIWYRDRATWEATMARLSDPAIIAEIIADEETLFDRPSMRFYCVEECESEMG